MTKARYYRLLRTGLILILGFVLGVSFWATTNKQSVDQVEQSSSIGSQQENRGQEQNKPFWEGFAVRTITDPVTLYTLVLTLFTGLLWRSTEKLWRAGERQRKVSEGALEIAHEANRIILNDSRAWLKVDLLNGKIMSKIANGPLLFTITQVTENLGNRPAIGVHIYNTPFESSLAFATSAASDHHIADARSRYSNSESRIIYPKLPHKMDNTIGGRVWGKFDPPSEGFFLACVVLYRSAGDNTIHHTAKVFAIEECKTPQGTTTFFSFSSADRIS